ncbi:MAG: HD domain-containing protein [Cyclobacteriaceae bacterium]
MIKEGTIVKQAESYAREILWRDLPESMTYHSINHTIDVVESAIEIGRKQGLDEGDIEILQLAAWFHDLGYSQGCENHEKLGADMAREFLVEKDYPADRIDKVTDCIMATQMPQNPKNYLDQILCDADLIHLADEDYFSKADLLHKEIEHTKSCKISEVEWLEMNQDFLNKHCFFTEYAKTNYDSGVKENLKKVRQRLKSWVKTEK